MNFTLLASRVVLGEVLGPHGLRGALRIRLHGDDVRHLARSQELQLGRDSDDPHATTFRVQEAKPGRSGEARLQLEGVASREAAEALGGLVVLGDPQILEKLPVGEFYWYELVGCTVYDEEGGRLGRLRELLETGAHDVFVVEGDDKSERLYPAAEALLREVDPAAGRIVIAVPEVVARVEAAEPKAD